MAHLRRFHYQSRRCCSLTQPSVASLPDFSDSYLEEIKVRMMIFHLLIGKIYGFIFEKVWIYIQECMGLSLEKIWVYIQESMDLSLEKYGFI